MTDDEFLAEYEAMSKVAGGKVTWTENNTPDLVRLIALARIGAADAISRLTAERDEALEALKPFANETEKWKDWIKPTSEACHPVNGADFTIGDLRRATLIIAKVQCHDR